MDSYLHASVAEPLTTKEIVIASDVQWNHVSSGSPGPIVKRVFRVA